MKVLLLGGSGTIGKGIYRLLSPKHELILAGRNGPDVKVDYADPQSVRDMFEKVGKFDALVAAVGNDALFKRYEDLTDDDYEYGFRRKFMAQINLVRIGMEYANDSASFTLTTGFRSDYPHPAGAAVGPFNAALDSFVLTVGPTLPRGIRLNVVSPATVVPEGEDGLGLVTPDQTAEGYAQSIEGTMNGKVIRMWGGLEKQPYD
uniref:Short chain dehydrogenase n=1 Tax=Ditylum brightwellii TaxID=49249 RepID=A0A7S4SA41_9STRA|mmetsp:Transcript_13145/g.17611  ORF Transcript_13145/g.17611 Transcript_13145/m.17611 type:complete len:204 (+) Transcript_13145:49-660(+)